MEPTPEQKLFARILRLTLLRGVVIGLFVAVIGIWIYHFPSFFEGPFGSIPGLLAGTSMVLQAEEARLRSQFLALPQGKSDHFSTHFLRLLGSFFIVAGVVLLISKPLHLPNPTIPETQQASFVLFLCLAFLSILLLIGGISWYLSLRDRRSEKQPAPHVAPPLHVPETPSSTSHGMGVGSWPRR